MQTPGFPAAVPAEMRELSAARQAWYTGRHAASGRMYWVYTPAGYRAGTAVPLIMVLHGCVQPFFSHPWAIAYDTHMNQLAETHQFLVVYPHEFAPPDVNPESCWNYFLPDNQHRGEGEPAAWSASSRTCSATPPGGRSTRSASMWPASPQAGARPPIWELPTLMSSPLSRYTPGGSMAIFRILSVSRRQRQMPWLP